MLGPIGRRAVVGFLAALTGLCVLYPTVIVAWRIGEGSTWRVAPPGIGSAGAVDGWLLVRTGLVAALVGVLATLAAWPAAWVSRGLPSRAAPILLVPMLMPSYLAFAGWSLLRAPGTWLGNWLMRGPGGSGDLAANWWPLAGGRVLAVLGLSLWAWPLAALVLGAGVRWIDSATLDSLRLEPMGRLRRGLVLAGMLRSSLGGAVLAVTLVMIGSAVPFHLAQLDTYSIRIWRLLDETAHEQHWRVWAAAWPLMTIATVVGVVAGRGATSGWLGTGDTEPDRLPPWRSGLVGALGSSAGVVTILLWSAAVLAPIALFALSIRGGRSLTTFWRVSGGALGTSLGVALGVATLGAAIIAATWISLGSGSGISRRLAVWSVRLLLIAGLVPGVLVGSATSAAWNTPAALAWVADSSLVVVIGHVARFGFIAALVGAWLWRTEPRELRDLRRLDAGDSLLGWALGALPAQAPTIAGAALAIGLLSFNEVESAVILEPPGLDSFARQMLQLLHYNRMEDLSAAVVIVVGAGVVGGAACAWLLGRRDPDLRT